MTRAEIEEIRGVATSKGTLDVLLETGWIRLRGRRKAPGRPVTYGTTEAFLSHFGLEALGDLPGLDELKGAGLLDGSCRPDFAVPVPSDDPALRDDEDPLEPGDLDLGLGAAAPSASRGMRLREPTSSTRRNCRSCASTVNGARLACGAALAVRLFLPLPRPSFWSNIRRDAARKQRRRCGGFADGFV